MQPPGRKTVSLAILSSSAACPVSPLDRVVPSACLGSTMHSPRLGIPLRGSPTSLVMHTMPSGHCSGAAGAWAGARLHTGRLVWFSTAFSVVTSLASLFDLLVFPAG
uniref:Uncharacterized protein n=1 Tax=Ixodes ricinus TaxID=34613 RepID=A0A6B0UGT1_IXORI